MVVTGGFEVLRSKALPLSEDCLFCEDELLTMANRRCRTEITQITRNLGGPCVAAVDEGHWR